MRVVRGRDGRSFETTGDEVITFIEENLTFSNGRWTGQPFRLLGWQKLLLYELFELNADGRRRYRRALIGVGRKNGKTELAAALALYLAFADGEPSAEVYAAAASEEQADRVFDAAKRMVELSPTLPKLIGIQVGRLSAIENPYSYIQRLTSKGKTKHGLNIHAVVLDELHAWGVGEQDELWAALTTGMAAREQPMQIAITTAGTDLEQSRCGELYTLGQRVNAGEVEDPTLYFRWWEAPEDADWRSPETWRQANPSYGHTVNEDFYKSELNLPESVFRRLYLNQWVEAEDFWLPWGAWESCLAPLDLQPEMATAVGWDASTKHDSTAIVAAQRQGERIVVKARVWERPVGMDGRPVEEWRLPIGECEQHVRQLCQAYNVKAVAYDPAFITWSASELLDQGLPMLEWPQTNPRMVPATMATYEAAINGVLAHDGDVILARHIRSAQAVNARDGSGQRLTKRHAGKKIDAAVALVMAVHGLQHFEPERYHGIYIPADDDDE